MSFNENGRSMIEMLGVLTIVGILSVSGISGFSKAMVKHKLNKQSESLSLLFDSVDTYRARIISEKLGSMELVPVFQLLGEIPDGLNLKGTCLYDGFANRIRIYTNGCYPPKPCMEIALNYQSTRKSDFAICNNIFQVAIVRSSSLYRFTTASTLEDNPSTNYENVFYGDNYCFKKQKCIRDITFNDIHKICRTCVEKKTCSHIFIWRS